MFLVSFYEFSSRLKSKGALSAFFEQIFSYNILDVFVFVSELNKLPLPLLINTCFLCYSEILKALRALVDIQEEVSCSVLLSELHKKKPWAIPIALIVLLFYFFHRDK
jgi:hypothetical protein